MHLRKFHGINYKSIEDSGEIFVQDQITRLVGQNEAGKTALLELLRTLRPVGSDQDVFEMEDYPRKTFSQYKRVHETNPQTPVTAEFELDEGEIDEIEKMYGRGVLKKNSVQLSKKYGSKKVYYKLDVNESAFISKFIEESSLEEDIKSLLLKAKTVSDLQQELEKLNPELKEKVGAFPVSLTECVYKLLSIPHFFYFDEYASLPGEISLKKLQQFLKDPKTAGDEAESFRTAQALIDIAGVKIEEFLNKDNYERLKADLEAASNEITDQLRRSWTTNRHLEIQFDLQPETNSQGQITDTILHVRVYNTKHRVTVPFAKRSKGFVWFFSFLVAFTQYKDRKEKIILLLDEPGANLGAKAQRDLLRYFDDFLVGHHQIIFTTHSPFMIDVKRLETVRTVEDEDGGTKVSNDPCKHGADTLFPLQAALGYDLGQSLFVAQNNLLVEGPADLIYLTVASQVLVEKGCQGLTDSWTIVPVGGADKVATFVSLLGAQGLNLAVFMDASAKSQQKIHNLIAGNLLLKNRFVTVGNILDRMEADIEDLFSSNAYLKLVNLSYGQEIAAADIEHITMPRIVSKMETLFSEDGINNGKFNHYKLAHDLIKNQNWQNEIFDTDTCDNFEMAFKALNGMLEESETPNLPLKIVGHGSKKQRPQEASGA